MFTMKLRAVLYSEWARVVVLFQADGQVADHIGRAFEGMNESSLARTLRSWVQILLKAWMFVCVYSLCLVQCVDSGPATG
jgi:hypothetical protein